VADNPSLLIFVALILGAFIVFFIVGRMFVLWYFRIDEHIANQQRMIALLEVISTERSRNVSRPVISAGSTQVSARTGVLSAQSQNQSSALGSPPVHRPGS
jgi:hypothetical protein